METIPPEVLCKIFLESLPYPYSYGHCDFRASVAAPLYISHVCKAWRSLALSFGELWSYLYIHFQVFRDEFEFPPTVGDIMDTWIARSNEAPLNYEVSCHLHEVEDMRYHADVERIVTALVSQQHRWEDITILCGNVKFSSGFVGSGISLINMPLLKSLSLEIEPLLNAHCVLNTSHSPHLESLRIDNNFKLETVKEPMRSLKRLTVAPRETTLSTSLELCRKVLDNAPCLDDFYADFSQADREPGVQPAGNSAVLSSNPRSLTIRGWDLSKLMFNAWKFPSLQGLRVEFYYDGGPLVDFLKLSSPPLTFLSLLYLSAADHLSEIVLLLPALQGLQLLEMNVSTELFQTLTVVDGGNSSNPLPYDGVACPRLEALHLKECFPEGDDGSCVETLIAMLKSRAKITPSFKTVHIGSGWVKYDVNSVEKRLIYRGSVTLEVGDIHEFYIKLF